MKKFSFLMATVLAAGTLLAACGGADDKTGTTGDYDGFKVGMVTDTGGVDDKSFNQSAWEGLTKFGQDFDIPEKDGYKYLQSNNDADYQPNLKKLVRDGFDLSFGIGFLMAGDVKEVALQKPESKFAIVDMVVTDDEGNLIPNVANITFAEEQGSFLVGVVAGLHTKTNKVGFLGGVNFDLIKKFENGFKAGVKSVNPSAKIIVQYADSFVDVAKGQLIANSMYSQGADIIYHAAGGTGLGAFTEAKDRSKKGEEVWVIGVDKDQHQEGMPENVTLTSMVKRVDNAVYDVSKKTKEGNFPGGQVLSYSLADGGVGIAPTTDNVSEEALAKVEEYKQKIINGEITVPKTDDEFEKSEFNK
ncbi:BMP family ABC transporter substrate-binding protein [Lottiidibacillus patelloidae]|uniref:BMP family ABC transporter substrate-binding protein n=1 Tax=Lottiidibacillus patelloidae TaxID=2670334 RepID=A0A263BWL3_9BACI|nr:BMP family protein [Lottiidibacillus patelloidae]OZM58050.1 BMP family ABC transporter substrate-binding protein [Lottiidibacillus patelloidae]